ncbi:MAG: cyclase family protein [Nitrososphaeraceae archaeon]|nr:cyclase family protein [Nitrososphaeraceae archaeon]MBV9669169.1 cyclase family protein [Nitrososphaeraceae archaeon]
MEKKGDTIITISRKFYDLSQAISKDIPVYSGDPEPDFVPSSTIERNNYNVTRIIMGSHSSTHVDAQSHFIIDGNSVDREPISKFIGESVVIDLSSKLEIGNGITCSDLEAYSEVVKDNDILLIYTGTSEYWMKDQNIKYHFTYLEPSAAQWIASHHIKCVGIDTFSVEKYGSKDGLSHKILLSSSVGIIENLSSNLKNLSGKKVFLVCLPLLLEGVDGSPARTIAFDIV